VHNQDTQQKAKTMESRGRGEVQPTVHRLGRLGNAIPHFYKHHDPPRRPYAHHPITPRTQMGLARAPSESAPYLSFERHAQQRTPSKLHIASANRVTATSHRPSPWPHVLCEKPSHPHRPRSQAVFTPTTDPPDPPSPKAMCGFSRSVFETASYLTPTPN